MSPVLEVQVVDILASAMSELMARSVVRYSLARSSARLDALTPQAREAWLDELERGARLYAQEPAQVQDCLRRVRLLVGARSRDERTPASSRRADVVPIREEGDIVTARVKARELSQRMGFSSTMQVRVATIVSELARNIVQYAGKGEIQISTSESDGRPMLAIRARDDGPGIANLDQILGGGYKSRTGLGKGLLGTRNMVDQFDVKTAPGKGTDITARMFVR